VVAIPPGAVQVQVGSTSKPAVIVGAPHYDAAPVAPGTWYAAAGILGCAIILSMLGLILAIIWHGRKLA
jgi:hypothetical protein